MNDAKEYWEIYSAVNDLMNSYGLTGTDKFINACVDRIKTDAGADWSEADIRISIRNQLNEMIESNM